ncbi:MAG: type II toxin-antitoxin system VapC family toxin [Kutzneria sp.]|nr:type II toxin-antitoxin system VapC family toxin [Kutzneria sp.]MBV9843844.1 type II toxin-antitoxin system VapC family toxin [Kutzneria sp.]
MSSLVIDASAFVYVATSTEPEAAKSRTMMDRVVCHAPHLIDAEVGNVLRRHELAGRITPGVAATGLRLLRHLVDERYPATGPLGEAAWRLRGSITFYDALYVALANMLGAKLVTGDARLTRAPGLPCEVELVRAGR